MRTLVVYPIDPEPSPTEVRACMLNAQQQEDIVPSELLFTVPFTRRGAILGWAQLRNIPWRDLAGPTKPSRSARLLYHQRAIDQCDALVVMRRSQIPSTHSDLLMRAVRERKRLFVWFLTDAPHCRPLVLDDEVIWPEGCGPDAFEARQAAHIGEPITRAEALRISRETLENAERQRDEFSERQQWHKGGEDE